MMGKRGGTKDAPGPSYELSFSRMIEDMAMPGWGVHECWSWWKDNAPKCFHNTKQALVMRMKVSLMFNYDPHTRLWTPRRGHE
jgi:hypothetical protein